MTHDPTALAASEQAYEEGYLAGQHDSRRGVDDPNSSNPYTEMQADRRAYVRERVTNVFGTKGDEDGDAVLDDLDWFDELLDAHADWIAGRQARATDKTPEPLLNTDADLPQPADCLPGDVYLVRTHDAGSELVAASRLPENPGDSIPWRALHTEHQWHGDHEITIIAELYRRDPVITAVTEAGA